MMIKFTEETLNEAQELGVSVELLTRMFNKGVAAWDGSVPGSTPHQLGHAVVEQYLMLVKEAKADEVKNKEAEEDEENEDKTDDTKDTKDTKNKKNIKYSNAQPGETYASSRMGGVSGSYFGSISEELKDVSENLREWALSDYTQRTYAKKYGKKAKGKLIEAVHKLAESLNKKLPSIKVNNEPNNLVQMQESKRKNFELAVWHTEQSKLYEKGSDQHAHHNSKWSEYNEKLKGNGKT